MSVERSERGALTTNADYNQSYQDIDGSWISTSQQWDQYDNKTVIRRYNQYKSSIGYFSVEKCLLSCTTNLNYDLEYSVIVYTWDNVKWSESAWYDNNTPIYQSLTSTQWNNSDNPNNTANIAWKWEIWVRRKDGGDLSRQDFQPCMFSVYRTFRQIIEQTTALPQNWLETTTQSIPTYTTQTTMVTTVDYESYLSTLTVPADVRPAIAQLDQLINDLWSLHYIPFVVCFALIMGLAIWLLH